jgi:integrase
VSRPNQIWYWKARKFWCVTINGKRHKLAREKEAAKTEFHRLMSQVPAKPSAESIAALLDAFVVFSAESKAATTAKWYETYLQDFLDYLTAHGHRPATLSPSRLTPRIVRAWADRPGKDPKRGKPTRARITAVKAAYRWAHSEGWIDANPIAAMRRPAAPKREELVSLAEMKAILRNVKDRCFRFLLIVSWDSGARPQELRRLRDIHVDLDKQRCVLPASEAKGKKKGRVIYLTARAVRIIRRLLQVGGHVFRNSIGRPWTASAVKCRFARLEKNLGRRYCQYLWRHSFATRKLKAGVSPIVVAELLGHSDVSTLAKVYQHVAQDPAHMLIALNAEPT